MAKTEKAKTAQLLEMQRRCDDWNAAHPIGTDVFVNLDFKPNPFQTKTRSKAEILSGHSVVIWLENVSGCYLLDNVTPVEFPTQTQQ